METAIDIKAVTAQIAQGDEASFELLYRAEVDRVFAYVSYRVYGRETALEVVQDCFVELYRSLQKFTYQSDAAFYSFLFTVVKRRLARHYAEQKKRVVGVLDETHHEAVTVSPEITLAITAALKELDEVSREIVVLHHWSRYSFFEIGAMVGMTESAVRVRHHRARATLKEFLTK